MCSGTIKQVFLSYTEPLQTFCTQYPSLPPDCSHHVLLLFLPLQLGEVSLDPSVAGLQVLGGVKNLISLTAGEEQLVGTLSHSHLKVQLFLNVSVLLGHNIRRRKFTVIK